MRPRGNPSPILHRRPRKTVAAIRLLPLTGCRSSDILHPRRRDIGKEAINLPDSKPGPFAVPLSETARAPTEALPGHREPDTSLFRATPKAGVSALSRTVTGRFARMRSSAGSARVTFDPRSPAKRPWRARHCRWLAGCSGTADTGPRQATHKSPMRTLSTPRNE